MNCFFLKNCQKILNIFVKIAIFGQFLDELEQNINDDEAYEELIIRRD